MPDSLLLARARAETAVEAFMRRTAPENIDATIAEHCAARGDSETARIYREQAAQYRETLGR